MFDMSLAPGYTIWFYPPSSYSHTAHELRYDGSCPGDTQFGYQWASNPVGLFNTRSTSVNVYYTQCGFPSADSDLNVQWAVEGVLQQSPKRSTFNSETKSTRAPAHLKLELERSFLLTQWWSRH